MIQWTVTVNATLGTARYTPTCTAPNFVDLSLVVPGDYVNIYGANFRFGNQGSYAITNVVVDYVAGVVAQYFEVANPTASAQSAITQIANSDLNFFRPHRASLNDAGLRTVVVAQSPLGLEIVIPATTDAIQREIGLAAYLHATNPLTITSVSRDGTGLVTATVPSHGLATGQSVFIDGVYALNAGRLNGLFSVTVVNANTFTYQTPEAPYSSTANGGTATPVAAISNSVTGPYVFDDDEGVAITSVETTLQQTLVQGQSYRVLTVTDATAFPDAPGWLAFAFGTAFQVGPVNYLGRISNTQLLLNSSFLYPLTVPTGSAVTLLAGRLPYAPTSDQALGAFYVTASAAGRVAAEQTIDALVGAGIPVTKTIAYPGDKGLGNAGLPTSGTEKLSDQIVVWGSDDVDTEVTTAREE